MEEALARALIKDHFEHSNISVAGGGPLDDIAHDLWVNEYTIRYDNHPVRVVGIMEFRDDKVIRERIYFGEPWDPPAWRSQWVERMDPE